MPETLTGYWCGTAPWLTALLGQYAEDMIRDVVAKGYLAE